MVLQENIMRMSKDNSFGFDEPIKKKDTTPTSSSREPRKDGSKRPSGGRRRFWTWLLVFAAIILVMNLVSTGGSGASKEISYTQLRTYLTEDVISGVTIGDDNSVVADVSQDKLLIVFGPQQVQSKRAWWQTSKETNKGTVESHIGSVDEFDKFLTDLNTVRTKQGLTKIDIRYEKSHNWWTIILNLVPFLIFLFFLFAMFQGPTMLSGGGGIFGVGKAQAKTSDDTEGKKVTFKDVAGLEGAKQEVEEIVSFLKNPKKYTVLGGKIPKGALLVGPPGTGKTLLAKAVAGEANVPFFSMSGSDFVEMFVGVGASRVRDLFRQAKEKAPCIIFIDEIDAVGRSRSRNGVIGSNDERESTLNQLLTEMDGFATNSGVILLAATNRADVLDPALLRAGRFDRQIHVELPNLQERKAIFEVHTKPLKLDRNVDVNFLSKQTPGFSGADIANVCNEAALVAARKEHRFVDKQDFMDAVDRIVGGLERKSKIVTDDEKKSIAFHEAGHATISWLLRWADPLVKVSIVPRGASLGAAWYLPEERQLTNKDHILDELCSLLGGRAAEEAFLHQTSTGAMNDLERATKQSYAMVVYYGMSEKLKNLCYFDSTGQSGYNFQRPYSEHTAEIIDAEVQKIITSQMQRAKELLNKYASQHHKIAQLLIDKEVITSDDVAKVLGPRKWQSRGDEILTTTDDEKKPVQRHRPPRKKKVEGTDVKPEEPTNNSQLKTNNEQ